jgi:kynurenine formamidase
MQGTRWKNRPEGSNWGDFGPDDQLGRLNLLTPQKVLQGIAEVREGKTFCLSMPLDYPGGSGLNTFRLPPKLKPSDNKTLPSMNYPLRIDRPGCVDVVNDDVVELNLQYSTQWDSLAHIGQFFDADGDGIREIVYYNGFKAGEHIRGAFDHLTGEAHPDVETGAFALGVEHMAANCIQGRGVMIDFEAHFGLEHKLVGYDDLSRILEADQVEVEEGDIVAIRTGTAKLVYGMNKNPDNAAIRNSCAKIDGRDQRLLQWITDTGLVAVVCDNNAVEASPSRPAGRDGCAALPLHEHCLFKLGVYLGEFWDLGPLADWLRAHGRYRFLLTAPPLRLPGAVGSPVTPVATV